MTSIILIDENSPDTLVYDSGKEIFVYDTTFSTELFSRCVYIKNWTTLHWFWKSTRSHTYNLQFFTENNSHSTIRFLLLAALDVTQELTLSSRMVGGHSSTNIHILSLVGGGWNINLNGIVHIEENLSRVRGHILEENIFLGSRGSIRGIPSLIVHSDDVEAGHAARIERIPDEKLYYLRARGIPRDDASVLMIESSVHELMNWFGDDIHAAVSSEVLDILRQ